MWHFMTKNVRNTWTIEETDENVVSWYLSPFKKIFAHVKKQIKNKNKTKKKLKNHTFIFLSLKYFSKKKKKKIFIYCSIFLLE